MSINRKSKSLKITILFIVLTITIATVIYQDLIVYGIEQGKGQMKIIFNSKPIEHYLTESQYPDSLKYKILLITEIKQFAYDSLALRPSENYTTVYDQKNKPILWTLTASEKFELKPFEWTFPVVGAVSYKGFFDYNKALEGKIQLENLGYETSIDEISAWSTLGWFKDPILSSMLYKSEGSLANLIIHELTHGTMFVKNNLTFNENLANFVGDQGAELFLKYKFGDTSIVLYNYRQKKEFNKKYNNIISRQTQDLKMFYKQISQFDLKKKNELKANKFYQLNTELLRLYKNECRYGQNIEKYFNTINNTFYLDENRYNEKQNQFEQEFYTKFDGNFRQYLTHLKSKYSE